MICVPVSLPYGFTLFSNIEGNFARFEAFHYLMDLHYSQTKIIHFIVAARFHYLMDLHYSQTNFGVAPATMKFHYLMDLHYSQTL